MALMGRMQQTTPYITQSKNPYATRLLKLRHGVFVNEDTEKHAGQWRNRFSPAFSANTPLHVEIGCNGGHVITQWAAQNPTHAYMGLDWKFKQVYRAHEKAQKIGARNVLFLRAKAERIDAIFARSEVDHLYIYFPDPWPKRSHWKNRFIHSDWLKKASRVIRPGGTLEIKTDHEEYFDWILNAFYESKSGFDIEQISKDLYRAHPSPLSLDLPNVTLFEKIFLRQGLPIGRIIFRRV